MNVAVTLIGTSTEASQTSCQPARADHLASARRSVASPGETTQGASTGLGAALAITTGGTGDAGMTFGDTTAGDTATAEEVLAASKTGLADCVEATALTSGTGVATTGVTTGVDVAEKAFAGAPVLPSGGFGAGAIKPAGLPAEATGIDAGRAIAGLLGTGAIGGAGLV